MAAKWALEASWGPLGAVKKATSAKGGLPGAYGALLDGSWGALGAEKGTLERLLAAPREIPRQVSAILAAKRLQKGGQEGPKSRPTGDPSRKREFFKNYCFFKGIP